MSLEEILKEQSKLIGLIDERIKNNTTNTRDYRLYLGLYDKVLRSQLSTMKILKLNELQKQMDELKESMKQ